MREGPYNKVDVIIRYIGHPMGLGGSISRGLRFECLSHSGVVSSREHRLLPLIQVVLTC